MTIDPRQAERLLAAMCDPKRTAALADGYGWISEMAHSRHVGAASGGGTGPTDPTGQTAEQRRLLRNEWRSAGHSISAACAHLAAAEAAIDRAMALADPGRHSDEADPGAVISRGELEEARAAQRRRTASGNRWGRG